MIAKGTTHDNGARLGRYLINGKQGEQAELWQLRGFAEADIVDAFRSIHIMAEATQCEKPFFHVQVSSPNACLVAQRVSAATGLPARKINVARVAHVCHFRTMDKMYHYV